MLPTPEDFRSFHYFLSFVSHSTFYGVPMDVLAHFFVGGWLIFMLRSLRVSFKYCYIMILCLCLVKEGVLDFPVTMSRHLYWEPIKDSVATFAGALLVELSHLTARVETEKKIVSRTSRG